MNSRNPSTILYDGYGTPVAVLEGDIIFGDQPALLFAGEDENGLVKFISLAADGAIKTAEVGFRKQQQFDIDGNDFMYIGTGIPGLATSAIGWSIKRFELNNNKTPIDSKTTEPDSAIWDDRVSAVYE